MVAKTKVRNAKYLESMPAGYVNDLEWMGDCPGCSRRWHAQIEYDISLKQFTPKLHGFCQHLSHIEVDANDPEGMVWRFNGQFSG